MGELLAGENNGCFGEGCVFSLGAPMSDRDIVRRGLGALLVDQRTQHGGNIVFGGIVGLAVDAISGGLYLFVVMEADGAWEGVEGSLSRE